MLKPDFVLVRPPETQLPLRGVPLRFAACAPQETTTNSWRVWAQHDDVYVTCRDGMRELKVSLHASGKWRFGFTEGAVAQRPELGCKGQDRAWTKWSPPADQSKPFVAFQVLFPVDTAYLEQSQRTIHSPEILIPFPADPGLMVVASVCVGPTDELMSDSETPMQVLGVYSLSGGRSAQVILTHDPAAPVLQLVKKGFDAAVAGGLIKPPSGDFGLYFLHGLRGITPFFVAVPYTSDPRRAAEPALPPDARMVDA